MFDYRIRNRFDKYELVNTDVAELDITDIDAVLRLVREVKPYAIINCAAHTGVDACEEQVDLAYKINAIGPRNLSIGATETGAKMTVIFRRKQHVDCLCKLLSAGRGSYLVSYNRHLFFCLGKAQHCLDKVFAVSVKPGCTQDKVVL